MVQVFLHVDGEVLRHGERSPWENDEKFIAAPAARVASSCGVFLHEVGEGADDGIAGSVAVGVIDFLEMIKIDHDGRECQATFA